MMDQPRQMRWIGMDKKVFFTVSLIVILLMYLVPYLLLSGWVGPATYIFWIILAGVYLIFIIFAMRR